MNRRLLAAFFVFTVALAATPILVSASDSSTFAVSTNQGSSIDKIDLSQFPKVTAHAVVPVSARIAIEAGAHVSVIENGVPVAATANVGTSMPPEVVIVVDRSKSMGSSTFSATRNAAATFVSNLPAEVPVAIVSFNARVTIDASRTTDRQAVTSAINGLKSGGGTSLYDAIVTGSRQFSKSAGQKILVVLSDGGDSNSRKSLASALKAASRVQTLFIEVSSSLRHHQTLEYLGGENPVFSANSPADIERGFRAVEGFITSTIEVSFQSLATGGRSNDISIVVVHGGQRLSIHSTFDSPISVSKPKKNVFTRTSTLIVIIGLATLFYGLATVVFTILSSPGRSARNRLTPRAPELAIPAGAGLFDRLGKTLSRALTTTNRLEHLMQDIEDANLAHGPARFLVTNGIVAVGVSIVAGAFTNSLVAVLAFIGTLIFERRRLKSIVRKRRTEFIAQLPDTLQMLSSMLRSGYGLVQALDTVASEASEPTRSWLGQVMLEVRAGRDLINSLQALASTMDSLDFDWVVAGIEISREVGGDLAKTLDTVAGTIRERDELRSHINALTAEGRLSAYVMLVLPPAVAVMSLLINPEFGSLLFKPSGIPMMIGAGVLMIIGYAWMRKIIAKVA